MHGRDGQQVATAGTRRASGRPRRRRRVDGHDARVRALLARWHTRGVVVVRVATWACVREHGRLCGHRQRRCDGGNAPPALPWHVSQRSPLDKGRDRESPFVETCCKGCPVCGSDDCVSPIFVVAKCDMCGLQRRRNRTDNGVLLRTNSCGSHFYCGSGSTYKLH